MANPKASFLRLLATLIPRELAGPEKMTDHRVRDDRRMREEVAGGIGGSQRYGMGSTEHDGQRIPAPVFAGPPHI
jgi:hypothetical protein